MLAINRLRPRMNAWHLLNQMQEEFNREIADWFSAPAPGNASSPVVWTKPGEAIIAVALPGLELEDIDVSVHRNMVNISAKSRTDELPEGGRYLRQERVEDSIEHLVPLPFEPERDSINATYQRGVLVLRLSAAEASQPAKIQVKAG